MHTDTQTPAANPSAPVDVVELRRQLGDDDELIAETIQIFLEDYPLQLQHVAAAVATSDAQALRRSAHALRGAASNLWAVHVVEIARRLERQGESGALGGAEELVARLEGEMARLAAALTDVASGR
jgi:HPt (histidine-containing phosphotransfer) domain-containing protein